MGAKLSWFEEAEARRQESLAALHAMLNDPGHAARMVSPPPPPPPPPGPSDAELRWSQFMSQQLGPDPCKGERLKSVLDHFRSQGVNTGPDSVWGHQLKG